MKIMKHGQFVRFENVGNAAEFAENKELIY